MAKLKILFLLGVLCLGVWPVDARAAVPAVSVPEGYEAVAENATFALYLNRETLAFKVLDKRSGYLWSSNLDEVTPEDKLNKTWTAFARSGVSIEYMDAKTNTRRASITNAPHTLDVETVADGFVGRVAFTEPGITLTVRVLLEPAGVRVEVPFDGIREGEKFRLAQLHLYPFLGATKEDRVPGYMLIPDGCGSLIAFAAQTKAKTMFYGRYYGTDLGMRGKASYNPETRPAYALSAPVFGMVHGEGQHAFLAILERGSAYAELQAHPAGLITKFNFLYNLFIYNESYYQPTNRSGAGVTIVQPQTNAFDIVQHYRFLTGAEADYVGLARAYQTYLVDAGLLTPRLAPSGEMPLRLEFLGAEREKVLFWYRAIPMTTVEQMRAILEALPTRRVEVVYYGWQPGGAAAQAPTHLRLERALGSRHDLRTLADDIHQNGGALRLYLDPQAGVAEDKAYARGEIAMAITRDNLQGYHRGVEQVYFNLRATRARLADLAAEVREAGLDLALDGLGYRLYSDFRSEARLNREESLVAYQALLEEFAPLPLYRPAAYAWGALAAYYDMPLSDSGYIYTTRTVPFLPVVLAGYVPYYGPALNFSSNLEEDLLRHADYGAYPSFFLTQEATARILKTRSAWIYTSSYAQWGDEVTRAYTWLARLLGPVQGQPVVARAEPRPGVAVTRYANGMQIVVNYTTQPVTLAGTTIPPRDAVLVTP